MKSTDTIAAIATALGESGIGIIRISGEDAISIADKIYSGKQSLMELGSHTINYGHIFFEDEIIDEVLVMLMKSPRTFTGEDTVEINCHGGILILEKILHAVLESGARMALPGEFTKRAFLNGKMDLSQAEAVIDIIEAKNDLALKAGIRQLNGALTESIKTIRAQILEQIAFIEAALDDPEHYSLDGYSNKLRKIVKKIIGRIEYLKKSFKDGSIIKEGINTVIIGKPNAGKSSILNLLSRTDRAIVTDIAGTTRDSIDSSLRYDGETYTLIDTAGIRRKSKVEDDIEYYSILRAMKAIKRADVCVLMLDATELLTDQDKRIAGMIYEERKPIIIAVNKWDLIEKNNNSVKEFTELVKADLAFLDYAPIVTISALTGKRTLNILEQAKFINEEYHKKITTGLLNQILAEMIAQNPVPTRKGRAVKINYATQVSQAPPKFVFFANNPELIHFSYQRYIENKLREYFGFEGCPIDIVFNRKSEKSFG